MEFEGIAGEEQSGDPRIDLAFELPGKSSIAKHLFLFMVGSAVAVLSVVIWVLQVHYQDVSSCIELVDCLSLQECQIVDILGLSLPFNLQLFLLVDFVLLELSF